MNKIEELYERYKRVYEIESREGKYALEDLHMLSDLTKDQFIDRVKNDEKFADKWGNLNSLEDKNFKR